MGRVRVLADLEVLIAAIGEAWQYQHRPGLAISIKRLRKLGAELGTHHENLNSFYESSKYAALDIEDVEELEEWIEECKVDTELPRAFVWGDIPEAAKIDTARALCRRLECNLTELFFDGTLRQSSLMFVNRLSDYFWVLARFVEQENGNIFEKYMEGQEVK